MTPNTPQPNQHPGPLALVVRQLNDWQHLLAELQAAKAPAPQQAYCQIQRLQTEYRTLTA